MNDDFLGAPGLTVLAAQCAIVFSYCVSSATKLRIKKNFGHNVTLIKKKSASIWVRCVSKIFKVFFSSRVLFKLRFNHSAVLLLPSGHSIKRE